MSMNNSDGAEPNLTPILDMVFQLITFFMLVINFKGAALDFSLKLPVLGSARPLEYRGQEEPLVINITTDGVVLAYGHEVEPEAYVKQEANYLKARLGVPQDQPAELTLSVILRADKSVSFDTLNRVLRICQSQGFRQFSLSVNTRGESR